MMRMLCPPVAATDIAFSAPRAQLSKGLPVPRMWDRLPGSDQRTRPLGEPCAFHECVQRKRPNLGQNLPREGGGIGGAVRSVPLFVFPGDARHGLAPLSPRLRRPARVARFP